MLPQKNGILVFKDLPWYYAELLEWHVVDDVVKAFPKKPLSDKAHKEILRAFKLWGGKFVSPGYFELVLNGRNGQSTKTAVDLKRAYEQLQKET